MGAQATLAVLLLFTAVVNAEEKETPEIVDFKNENFIMKCPEPGDWFKKQAQLKPSAKTYTQTYNGKTKGLYHCKYKPKDGKDGEENKYYFYVKGKGCANCLEVEPEFLAAAIVVDVVVTACVMLMVFRCTKKKSSASSKAARPGGRPPPGQSEYEVLNRHTRSEEYSTVSRTG